METKGNNFWVTLRIVLGLIFLYGALNSLFGFTGEGPGWLNGGGSPTFGYLNFATYGPFSGFFQGLAGNPIVDVLHVGGQLLIGLSLLLGVGLRIAGYAGALQMFLIYLSAFPPPFNPILDEHIVYAIVLVAIAVLQPGTVLGFGKAWSELDVVKNYPILQ
ncbi:MAG: hypothetical protein AAF902_22895 [Chloroflexota bacterium]